MEITQILTFVLGLLVSVSAFFLKRAFNKLDEHEEELQEIKTHCASCNSRVQGDIVARIERMIDEKLDAWWLKVENGLMNEGRLPPRRVKRD